jgi:hypothetical protein
VFFSFTVHFDKHFLQHLVDTKLSSRRYLSSSSLQYHFLLSIVIGFQPLLTPSLICLWFPSILNWFLHRHIMKVLTSISIASSFFHLSAGLEDTWAYAHGGVVVTLTDVVLGLLCLDWPVLPSYQHLSSLFFSFFKLGRFPTLNTFLQVLWFATS